MDKEAQRAIDELVALGLVRETGKFEVDRNRKLQPIYVAAELVYTSVDSNKILETAEAADDAAAGNAELVKTDLNPTGRTAIISGLGFCRRDP